MKNTIFEYLKGFLMLCLVIGLEFWTIKSFYDGHWIVGTVCGAADVLLMTWAAT